VLLAFSTQSLGQAVDAKDAVALNRDLHFAITNNDRLALRDLLERGADPNAKEGARRPPLFHAVSESNLGIVKMLVEAGGDVNAQHPRQTRSILAEAAAPRRSKEAATRVVRFLFEHGAKADAAAMAAASAAGNLQVVEMLLDEEISPDAGLSAAARSGDLDIINRLLKAGANVDGGAFESPLFGAAGNGWVAGVKRFLDAGANPNVATSLGNTPIHRAITHGPHLPVLKLLVESGARIDLANNEGITPIRASSIYGAAECYDWLLAHCGGEEPAPSNIAVDGEVDTEHLFFQFDRGDGSTRKKSQRLLVARGGSIMPTIHRRLKQDGINSRTADLLAALGPRARETIPLLDSLLDDEEQVLGVMFTLHKMSPHFVDDLPTESKRRAASSLLKGVYAHAQDVYGGFYLQMLISLKEQATPQIVQLLEEDSSVFRGGTAEELEQALFDSEPIEAKLLELLKNDPVTSVRAAAATGLGNPQYHSERAKAALLMVLSTPVVKLDANAVLAVSAEERKRLSLEQQAVQDLQRETAATLASYGVEIIPQIREMIVAGDPMTQSSYESVYDFVRGDLKVVAAFAGLLEDPNDIVRRSAHQQLARLASLHIDEAGDILVRRFTEGHPPQRREAGRALVRIRTGSQAERYLPQQMEVFADPEFDLTTQMRALSAALWIDAERVKESKQAAEFVPALIQQIEHGEYKYHLQALQLVGKLGSAASSAQPLLNSIVEKPLPEKPATLPQEFRPGIDDQPGSEYRQFSRERHAAEIIRREASQALKAIENDTLE